MSRDYEKIKRYVAQLLAESGLFDEMAEIDPLMGTGNTVLLAVSWILDNDPERPALRSRPIRIAIQGPIIDELDPDSGAARKKLGARLIEIIRDRKAFGRYAPEPGPKGSYVLPFDIVITADEFYKGLTTG